ncbi:MAG: hypothetical protein U0694_24035 [Anaerolineae bacterium]
MKQVFGWKTVATTPFTSGRRQVPLFLSPTIPFDFTVDWSNDGRFFYFVGEQTTEVFYAVPV